MEVRLSGYDDVNTFIGILARNGYCVTATDTGSKYEYTGCSKPWLVQFYEPGVAGYKEWVADRLGAGEE